MVGALLRPTALFVFSIQRKTGLFSSLHTASLISYSFTRARFPASDKVALKRKNLRFSRGSKKNPIKQVVKLAYQTGTGGGVRGRQPK